MNNSRSKPVTPAYSFDNMFMFDTKTNSEW